MATAGKRTEIDKELEKEWVSLGDAARALGESRLAALTRTVKGELEAKHIAGRTLISRDSLNRVLALMP